MIYLDYNATTPIDPAVADVMEPFIRQHFGNPSSLHPEGSFARRAVEQAREQTALLLDTAGWNVRGMTSHTSLSTTTAVSAQWRHRQPG
ncbi:MAG: aminotransferase class V-fold PLP-dependent enzyme [Clostridia bacterium]|nr:aminotransferase class V-fold PLP-dependent enzyme [Clostridia bacterium]